MKTFMYHWRLLQYDYLLVTAAVLVLSVFVVRFTYHTVNQFDMVVGVLELVIPIPAAVLASAVFAGDPAAELICTAERPLWQTVASRLAVVIGLLIVTATGFEAYLGLLAISLPGDGNWLERQLVWISPSVVLILISVLASVWSRSPSLGAALAIGIWLLEILLRGVLIGNGVLSGFWLHASRRIFLFATLWETHAPFWLLNRELLLALCVPLTVGCLWRLSRSEWLIGGD